MGINNVIVMGDRDATWKTHIFRIVYDLYNELMQHNKNK